MNSQEINLVLADLSRNGIMFNEPENCIGFLDDFISYNIYDGTASPDGLWVEVTDGGVMALLDGHGGWLNVLSHTTDNDSTFISTRTEFILFQADKEVIVEAKLACTEVDTSKANWVFGLSSVVDGTLLGDNGAGPPAEYDGALFFKVDGTMYIQTETSNATTQVTSATVLAYVKETNYVLRIHYVPLSATAGIVHFSVNGVRLATHAITFTGLAEMHLCFGVKSGGTSKAETLSMDYVMCKAQR